MGDQGSFRSAGSAVNLAEFAPGQTFGVRDMATFLGPVTYSVRSGPAKARMEITLSDPRHLRTLFVHLRCPEGQMVRAVRVNGRRHTDFDPADQVVRISNPEQRLSVVVQYAKTPLK